MSDLPRVTEILRAVGLAESYGFLSVAKGLEVRSRGQAVHLAIDYHARGILDEATIHPIVAPYFAGYLRFLEEYEHEADESEIALEHPFGFQGHIDRVGSVRNDGPVLIDWKSSRAPDLNGAKYQCAAYRMLWDHAHPETRIERCLVVALPGDGTYRVHDVTSDYAIQVFTAAVIVYGAMPVNGNKETR